MVAADGTDYESWMYKTKDAPLAFQSNREAAT